MELRFILICVKSLWYQPVINFGMDGWALLSVLYVWLDCGMLKLVNLVKVKKWVN